MYAWHVGPYRCVASNVHGTDEKVTYIYCKYGFVHALNSFYVLASLFLSKCPNAEAGKS